MAELPTFHLEARTAGHAVTAAPFHYVFDIRVASKSLRAGHTPMSLREGVAGLTQRASGDNSAHLNESSDLG